MIMRKTLKNMIRARKIAWARNREVRHRPSDQEFMWMARSTTAIDDFLDACEIDFAKYASLKASVRAAAKNHLVLGIPAQEQRSESIKVVMSTVLQTHPWLRTYERTWPAMLYLHRYLKSTTRIRIPSRKTQPPSYGTKQSSSPALSRAGAVASERMAASPQPEQPPNIPDPDLVSGKSVVRQFLRLATPSLEAYVDAFVILGIHDQASLQGFLSWPPNVRVQWLNEENGVLRMTRLEVGSFLLHCENAARRRVELQ